MNRLIVLASLAITALVSAADPQNALSRAVEIQSQANLQAIQNAINSFKGTNDRNPTSLDELVTAGFLTELPAAPEGQKFVYDAQTGSVTVTGTPIPPKLPAPTPENAMKMALDVQAKSNLKKVTTALNVYMTEHDGQFPAKLDELVSSGMLDKLPAPPAGAKYSYDPKTGKVDFVRK
jgi:competence protein ComGC